MSRFEIGQRILKHFDLPLDSVQSVRKDSDQGFANRPSNLTFNLHPIVSKLKTKPATFEEQLQELTDIEPLRSTDH